ncbi:MAG: OmpH family outer membrane protein [Bacteroidota bacterium]
MKKLFTVLAIAFLVIGLSNISVAQNKIGYIDTRLLVSIMPEAKAADSALQDYQASLEAQGKEYITEFSEKQDAYIKDSAKFSAATKELKNNDLGALYQKIQNWNGIMQQMIEEKQQVLTTPIYTKAIDNIKLVAKENGYTYVLEAATLLVMPNGDDLLPLVKKKLNIKDPKPAAAPKPVQ